MKKVFSPPRPPSFSKTFMKNGLTVNNYLCTWVRMVRDVRCSTSSALRNDRFAKAKEETEQYIRGCGTFDLHLNASIAERSEVWSLPRHRQIFPIFFMGKNFSKRY